MSWDKVLDAGTRKARKKYRCDACEVLATDMAEADFSPEDLVAWKKIKLQGCTILAGDTYHYTHGIWEGQTDTFRARLDAEKLCRKYELYGE